MKNDLTKVLTYHVVPGSYRAADLKDGQKLKTANGKELDVKISNGNVTINGSTVQGRDSEASNGVVHSLDTVMTVK